MEKEEIVPTVTATLSISMDGVIQAPGRPDEDTRGGFDRGGWAVPYNDEIMAQRMAEGMSSSGAMLFGRRTYEDFYVLLIHPLVLGQGRRLFDERGPGVDLELVDSVTTSKGVIIATYEPR